MTEAKQSLTYRLSDMLAKYIQKKSNVDHLEYVKMRYGIENIIIAINKTIIIFILSFYLNLFIYTFFIFIFFNIFRNFSQGVHARDGMVCTFSSLTIFLGLSWIAKHVKIDVIESFGGYFLCAFILWKYGSRGTRIIPVLNPDKVRRNKIKMVIAIIICFCLQFIPQFNWLATSMLAGVVLVSLLVLPITYKLFGWDEIHYENKI